MAQHDTRAIQSIGKWGATGDLAPLGRRAGDLFFSGPIAGVDRATGLIPDDPMRQGELAFDNMKALVEQAGLGLDNIGHLFVWQKDHAFREASNVPWEKLFPRRDDRPARHAVQRDYPDNRVVTIEIIAVAGAKRQTLVTLPRVAHTGGRDPGFIPVAAILGDYLFSAATPGMEVAGQHPPDDPKRQIDLVYEHTETMLRTSGFTSADVGHVFVWQKDPKFRALVNEPWASLYPDRNARPARHSVTSGLPGNMAAQLEIIAVRNRKRTTLPELPGLAHTAEREPGFLPVATAMGDILFSGATLGTDPATSKAPDDLDRQIEFTFAHTKAMLDRLGFSFDDVAHAYVWHKDEQFRAPFDRAWRTHFPRPETRPARHDVPIAMPANVKVQLEIMAVRAAR